MSERAKWNRHTQRTKLNDLSHANNLIASLPCRDLPGSLLGKNDSKKNRATCTLRNSQIGRLNFVFENWTNVFEPFPREEGSKQISHPVRRYSCNFWKAARSADRPLFTDLCVIRRSSFLTIQGIQSSIYFQSTARYGLMSLSLDFFSLQAPRIFVIFYKIFAKFAYCTRQFSVNRISYIKNFSHCRNKVFTREIWIEFYFFQNIYVKG